MGTAADCRRLRLHLTAWFGLETNNRFEQWRGRQPTHKQLHARLATLVAMLLDLPEQHRRRNAVRQRRLHPIDNVSLERIKLLGPLRPRLAFGHLVATPQISPNRVARPPR